MLDTFRRLVGNLQIDASQKCNLLKWRPPLAKREGLEGTGRWYVESRSH